MEKKLADEQSGPIMTDFQVKVAKEKEAEKKKRKDLLVEKSRKRYKERYQISSEAHMFDKSSFRSKNTDDRLSVAPSNPVSGGVTPTGKMKTEFNKALVMGGKDEDFDWQRPVLENYNRSAVKIASRLKTYLDVANIPNNAYFDSQIYNPINDEIIQQRKSAQVTDEVKKTKNIISMEDIRGGRRELPSLRVSVSSAEDLIKSKLDKKKQSHDEAIHDQQ